MSAVENILTNIVDCDGEQLMGYPPHSYRYVLHTFAWDAAGWCLGRARAKALASFARQDVLGFPGE